MNYAQYLEDGGNAPQKQFTEQEVEMIKALQPYGEAFKQNPGGALEMAANDFNFSIESDDDIREFLAGLDAYAKLIGDTVLLDDIKKFGENGLTATPESFKCGGKVRAKVKKARCGKKLEKGAKVPMDKKGGCPCKMYKKVGGRLLVVDCNGVPMDKNGAVLKFQRAGQLPQINTQLDVNPNLLGGSKYTSQWLWGNGGSQTTVNPVQSKPTQVMPKSKLDQYENLTGDEAYRLLRGTPPEVIEQERLAAAEAAKANQKQTWRQMFDAGKAKYGGLTKEEALARQREMQAAKGFNVNLGKWGADGMWGNQSKSEWERYQAWKLDQERAANANLTRLESPVKGLVTTVIIPNAMTASNPNSLTLDKNRNIVNLNTLTPGQALQLDNAAWNRYLQYTRNRILSSKTGGKLNYADYLK